MRRGKETQFSLNSVMDWRSVAGTFDFQERWMLMGAFFKGEEMGGLIKIRALPLGERGDTDKFVATSLRRNKWCAYMVYSHCSISCYGISIY
jgi:hypothetical protein